MPALAIDLGGTKAAFAVVDQDGRILARAKHPSRSGGSPLAFHVLAGAASDTLSARVVIPGSEPVVFRKREIAKAHPFPRQDVSSFLTKFSSAVQNRFLLNENVEEVSFFEQLRQDGKGYDQLILGFTKDDRLVDALLQTSSTSFSTIER